MIWEYWVCLVEDDGTPMPKVPIDIELESWSHRKLTNANGRVYFKRKVKESEINQNGEVYIHSLYARLPCSPPFRNNKLLTSSVWMRSGLETTYVVDGDDWK